MQLTILGSGTAVPSLRRAAPGYLLRAGSDLVIMDAGSGTLQRLLRHGVKHDEVSHLLITHTHLDHCGEIAPWLFASRIPASRRTRPLTIGGSAGTLEMLAGLRGVYGHWLEAAAYDLRLLALEGRSGAVQQFEGWSLRAGEVNHIGSSLAYRVEDASGHSVVYSGDTAFCEELIELARGADLLLIECSAPDGLGMPGHLTPSEAGEIARRAAVRRVVLTHLYPACDEVDIMSQLRSAYDGPAALAEDGATFHI